MARAVHALLPAALCAALIAPATPVAAQEILGHGRLFTNDAIGDGKDRWRSGAYTVSRLAGPEWTGQLPDRPMRIREWRLRAEVIQPGRLSNPDPNDRRYAGSLWFGLHTHFALGAAEARLGGDLVVVGPQTGIGRFQRAVHKAFDLPEPRVLGNQIGNRVHGMVSGEIGLPMALSSGASLRPFVEAQVGVETLVRAGADLTIGGFGSGGLLLRDVTTGQRYRGIDGRVPGGLSFVAGADMAQVASSVWLPSGGPATLRKQRSRVRLGVHWQGERTEIFYGLTRLGREFEQQPTGQTLGSLRLKVRF
ncbi:MAG: lipid A-modifier LpxR family protein [Gemmobacter sp.]